MSQTPIALQLYTLREECAKDFIGTLKKVADLGYEGVEFAGFGGLEAKELKRVLEDIGLKAASSHIALEVLKQQLSDVIRYQQQIESRHIVCPFLEPSERTEAGYGKLIDILNEIGKVCHSEGMTFSYHHHDFELEPLENGRIPLEWILNETNPEWVKVEFDIYWLKKAGEEPLDWLRRYQGRTPLVHLKDMTTDSEQFFAELGTGGIDIASVLSFGKDSDIEWWIVEQDQSRRSPLDSVSMSLRYLHKLLG
jgi:sugar phosphate isomerase/epimerase